MEINCISSNRGLDHYFLWQFSFTKMKPAFTKFCLLGINGGFSQCFYSHKFAESVKALPLPTRRHPLKHLIAWHTEPHGDKGVAIMVGCGMEHGINIPVSIRDLTFITWLTETILGI